MEHPKELDTPNWKNKQDPEVTTDTPSVTEKPTIPERYPSWLSMQIEELPEIDDTVRLPSPFMFRGIDKRDE